MLLMLLVIVSAITLTAQNLRIFAIDVEGGKSTLYVAPSGESMLIDAGYGGHNNRDANRIVAAAAAAGVKRIDLLVVTHYHGDHAGGVPQLAAKLPIRRIYDYGDPPEQGNAKAEAIFEPYKKIRSKLPHTILKPGDSIPFKGLKVTVVASAGHTVTNPLPGAGAPNPLCGKVEAIPTDKGENSRSVALIIEFGKLRIADLGDLFWDKELELACPVNKLGTIDLFMTTHHGTATSGPPQIVQALHPKVAIMNNGEQKGGSVKAWKTITSSPGLLDLWQLHYSAEGGKTYNAGQQFIANPSADKDQGHWISVSASADGSFTVINGRNKFEKSYRK